MQWPWQLMDLVDARVPFEKKVKIAEALNATCPDCMDKEFTAQVKAQQARQARDGQVARFPADQNPQAHRRVLARPISIQEKAPSFGVRAFEITAAAPRIPQRRSPKLRVWGLISPLLADAYCT